MCNIITEFRLEDALWTGLKLHFFQNLSLQECIFSEKQEFAVPQIYSQNQIPSWAEAVISPKPKNRCKEVKEKKKVCWEQGSKNNNNNNKFLGAWKQAKIFFF